MNPNGYETFATWVEHNYPEHAQRLIEIDAYRAANRLNPMTRGEIKRIVRQLTEQAES